MKKKSFTREQLEQKLTEMRNSLNVLDRCRSELRKSKSEYQRLLETAPDAMVFVNREGRIVLVNAQLEEMFGYSAGELVGRELGCLIPERFREKHQKQIAHYFERPSARPMGLIYEIYGLRSDGTEFPADISLSFLEMDNEMLSAASVRNITERKQIEEKLEHNYHLQRVTSSVLKIALESLPLDEQLGRILDLILTIPHLSLQSKGAICLVEEKTDDFVIRAVRGFVGEESPPCTRIVRGNCLCGKAAEIGEIIFSDCSEGGHSVEPIPFPHGHYCVPIVSGKLTLGLLNVFVKEGHKRKESEEKFLLAIANTLAVIIERHKADQERMMLKEQLMQADKMVALGRLTANVAHEIRNPLTAVGGFARRLHKSSQLGNREKEYVDVIVGEVDRLEKILNNVLLISKGVELHKEPMDIHVLLDEVLQLYEFLCKERGIAIDRSYLLKNAEISVDRQHVREALTNVVANAIDSMPEGGMLQVVTRSEKVGGRDFLNITIHDSGVGIPAEQLEMIFEPFFTTKGPKKGTGLGLVLAKKAVEDHGGFIRIASEPGKGTTLDLFFPMG